VTYRSGQPAYRAEVCLCPSSDVSTRPGGGSGL
jgi:hypothetical protein